MFRNYTNSFSQWIFNPYLNTNLEPRDNTKNSNISNNKRSSRLFFTYTSLSSSCRFKKNISKSPNASKDKSANSTTNNNVKIKEEAPIAITNI